MNLKDVIFVNRVKCPREGPGNRVRRSSRGRGLNGRGRSERFWREFQNFRSRFRDWKFRRADCRRTRLFSDSTIFDFYFDGDVLNVPEKIEEC